MLFGACGLRSYAANGKLKTVFSATGFFPATHGVLLLINVLSGFSFSGIRQTEKMVV
jgi:hypothetical protein